ncbi:hypothetical protein CgunFtcFv8_006660 [Champsocephalus gunnari]|uniref:Uncharacterized protein n=1 Tax=Champsocephalus gunnari TaxID=52237 RepID=A0AAN8GVR0_CHAGU|nr:hypothetical protein CgunFtcFv8_006660 [Champsocephalus gunnari]
MLCPQKGWYIADSFRSFCSFSSASTAANWFHQRGEERRGRQQCNLMNETQSSDVNGDRLTHETRGPGGPSYKSRAAAVRGAESRRTEQRNPGRRGDRASATTVNTFSHVCANKQPLKAQNSQVSACQRDFQQRDVPSGKLESP